MGWRLQAGTSLHATKVTSFSGHSVGSAATQGSPLIALSFLIQHQGQVGGPQMLSTWGQLPQGEGKKLTSQSRRHSFRISACRGSLRVLGRQSRSGVATSEAEVSRLHTCSPWPESKGPHEHGPVHQLPSRAQPLSPLGSP